MFHHVEAPKKTKCIQKETLSTKDTISCRVFNQKVSNVNKRIQRYQIELKSKGFVWTFSIIK